MKKHLFILLTVMMTMLSCTDGIWNAIHDLEDKYNDLDGRVSQLEELCKEMNTNIAALQTLVSVIINNDYIVSITPIYKEDEEIGYVITFAIHSPITIYHGQNGKDGADGKDGQNGQNGQDGKDGVDGKDGADGKDGQDGKDGEDGMTPIIGVKQDPDDHAYYWTINGEWLLNAEGERIPVTSKDGKDGKDGADGQDGADGKDGKDGENGQDGKDGVDGITPQLKIEDGYWYVSTDNGASWTKLGKAVGENGQDGKDGKDGKDGQDGDSMFQTVTEDENFVYFTLANGTVLTVSKYKDDSVKIIDGAIMAEFSVSETKKVYFSQGNLQFNAMEGEHLCADGTTQQGTWRFAENQVEYSLNLPENKVTDVWQNSFVYGSSGYKIQPWSSSSTYTGDFTDSNNAYDWGYFNAIINGGNKAKQWRCLTSDEMNFLLNRSGGMKYDFVKLYTSQTTYSYGLIIFPDNYQPYVVNHRITGLGYITTVGKFFDISDKYDEGLIDEITVITNEQWVEYEKHGTIFIPYSANNYPLWTASAQRLYVQGCVLADITSSSSNSRVLQCQITHRFITYPYEYSTGGVRLVKDVD